MKTIQRKIRVMGILNSTPDSFFDGGKYQTMDHALSRVQQMIQEGVDIVDIGGESSRPGSQEISEQEELKRVIPLIQAVSKAYPKLTISVDTYKPAVADEAMKNGAHWINDIYGLKKKRMAEIAANYGAFVVIMHMRGEPKNMQKNLSYNDVVTEVNDFFKERIEFALKKGISQDKIILDPGIGFGKSLEDNIRLMKSSDEFKKLGYPVLIGASRKSMIGRILNNEPHERKNGSIVVHTLALVHGADILRVHDVKETREMVQIYEKWTLN